MTQTQIIGIIAASAAAIGFLTSLWLSAHFPNEPWLQSVMWACFGAFINSFSPSVFPPTKEPPTK